jgi:5-methylcytosine-specific restriction endonuclease McrA
LESKFEPWMNWSNHGNWNGCPQKINTAWDIDHIVPISSARNEEEIMKLNHYTNLQPLCSYTNRHIKCNIINFTE